MSFLFPKTAHKHVDPAHESGIPVGKELQEIEYREQRAVGGDFGGSHVHVPHDRSNGNDFRESHVHTSSLQQAAHRASEEQLHAGDVNYLKTPNLVRKTPHYQHHFNDSKVAVTACGPHSKKTAEHSSHSATSSKRFQFSWLSPLSVMYRTARRIYNFFASSNPLASSSSTLNKSATASFLSGSQRENRPSGKYGSENQRLQLIDYLENGDTNIQSLSEEHHERFQEHLKNKASDGGVAFTLEEYRAQMTKRAEEEMKAMRKMEQGVYSNLKPPTKSEEE
ncbi:MAG: hypothetical protein K2W99_05635 [Chthoniobacterales bacterium]|nr:hypothetical protein [Chthoniobacterales bacterium]